jgi:hypothetical protein
MRKPVYIPGPKGLNLWLALAEFTTLVLMWGGMLILAVFLRALMGV